MPSPQHIRDYWQDHATIRRAAAVAAVLERCRELKQQPPVALVREAQQNQAAFDALDAQDRQQITNAFMAHKTAVINEAEAARAQAFEAAQIDHADRTFRDFTKGVAGRPNGLTAEQAMALRAGVRPVLKVQKLPVGKHADELVREQTRHLTADGRGMSARDYERKLLHLSELGVTNPKYAATARSYFGENVNMRHLNRLVVDAVNDSVALELRRRSDKQKPDTVTMRGLDPREELRMEILAAVGESGDVEMNRTRDDNVAAIAENEKGTTRGAVAQAILDAGGLDAIDVGEVREDSSDEVVGYEDADGYEMGDTDE